MIVLHRSPIDRGVRFQTRNTCCADFGQCQIQHGFLHSQKNHSISFFVPALLEKYEKILVSNERHQKTRGYLDNPK